MIAFTGQYVNNLNVLQKDNNGSFKPSNMSFVKLNPFDIRDVQSVAFSVAKWDDSYDVGRWLVQDLCAIYNFSKEEGLTDVETADYYVATKQTDDFDRLKSEDILGVAQVEKVNSKVRKIKYFEVDPKYSHNNPDREIKHIGRAMLNSIKKLYSENNVIELQSLFNARKFYLGEGLVEVDKKNSKMVLDINA